VHILFVEFGGEVYGVGSGRIVVEQVGVGVFVEGAKLHFWVELFGRLWISVQVFVRTALLLELVFFLFLSQLHELSFHFFTLVAGLTELRFASLIFGRGTLTTFTEVDLVLEAHSGSSLSITTRHALKSVHLYPCLLLKPTHKEVFLLFQRSLR